MIDVSSCAETTIIGNDGYWARTCTNAEKPEAPVFKSNSTKSGSGPFQGVHKTRLLRLFHEFELAVSYNEQLGLTHGETADGHQRLIYS